MRPGTRLLLAALLGLTACGAAEPTRFYLLSPQPQVAAERGLKVGRVGRSRTMRVPSNNARKWRLVAAGRDTAVQWTRGGSWRTWKRVRGEAEFSAADGRLTLVLPGARPEPEPGREPVDRARPQRRGRPAPGPPGPVEPAAALDGLASQGYTCTSVHEGRSCQLVTPDPLYPVDRAQTYWLRDDVVVTVDQTNVPTDDLIGSIATRLFG